MLKKILLIIINMTFSFYSLMAIEIDEDGKTMPTSQPFIRKTMIYTFNEEGKMIEKEIDEDGKIMPISQPFIRKTMIYTFNEEGKMIGKEKEDESSQSEEIFLEVDSLLKEESRIQSKLASIRWRRIKSTQGGRNVLVTIPVICCCPCCILCSIISEYCIKECDMQSLMNEEVEHKIRLKELDQQIQDSMTEIYLSTGKRHPKMRDSTDPAYK